MRSVRWMALALTCVAAVPAVSSAQSRFFQNSWYWGAKAGIMSFSTNLTKNAMAPLVGGEWVITRTHGGLYMAYEQAFFKENAGITDFTGTPFTVKLHNMRRLTAALLAFPGEHRAIHPYGGLGFSLNMIQHVSTIEGYSNAGQAQSIEDQNSEFKDRASFLLMGGLQAEHRRFALFGQATLMPAQSDFFFSGRMTYIFEGGLRWNVGGAIDRP
jgi:hypothetical protein